MSLDGDLETRLSDAFDGGGDYDDDGDDGDDDGGGDGDLETSLDDDGTWGKLGVF